ncbi:hypothetical protein KIS1582_2717 [Cytobacillus firmus]|uniref:Uncharacterized protein n=1 Tax=Cytobacillus firmus TaxID=1399 RepID=A0A800MVY8_CYTFI|nr:hypothetical protein KIS1582_2717 [Cytobacillus firmus]
MSSSFVISSVASFYIKEIPYLLNQLIRHIFREWRDLYEF